MASRVKAEPVVDHHAVLQKCVLRCARAIHRDERGAFAEQAGILH
jgi:hypothetical protein